MAAPIRKLGWRKQPKDKRDVPFKSLFAVTPRQKGFKIDPTSRCTGLPPVMNQGGIGSCVAHGTVAAFEAVRSREGMNFLPLSRLFLYWAGRVLVEGRDADDDSGMYVRDALKTVANIGLPNEVTWPYDPARFAERPSPAAFAEATQHKAIRYYSLDTLDWIKACLTLGYPVIFGFEVPEAFMSDEVAHTGQAAMPGKDVVFIGGHCVLAYGHDDEHDNGDGTKGALYCRNSWGPEWGLNGDFWLPYGYVTKLLASDFFTIHQDV